MVYSQKKLRYGFSRYASLIAKSLNIRTKKAPNGQNKQVHTGNSTKQTTSPQSISTDLVGNLSSNYSYLSFVWATTESFTNANTDTPAHACPSLFDDLYYYALVDESIFHLALFK